LTSAANITDDATAETRIQDLATFTGINVIIGDEATDCFDIIVGGAGGLTVNATATNNVVFGGC
jgi:hypothetical protein